MTGKDRSGSSTRAKRTGRSWLGPLWLQVLLAICLGALVGTFYPHGAASLKPLGDGFIRLISMTLAPIIFLSVVLGIAHMGDLKEVGRVGIKALVYFEVVSPSHYCSAWLRSMFSIPAAE